MKIKIGSRKGDGLWTGPRTHESRSQEKREGVEMASSKQEYVDLGVTSLSMVSETCSK